MYSGLFSAKRQNHPIPSVYQMVTGKKSPSTGLSRSFSDMVRGRLPAAKQHNPHGPMVFFFFLGQFLARLILTGMLLAWPASAKNLVKIDIPLSILGFSCCFSPFIVFFFKLFA
jgi:hypothetical protein